MLAEKKNQCAKKAEEGITLLWQTRLCVLELAERYGSGYSLIFMPGLPQLLHLLLHGLSLHLGYYLYRSSKNNFLDLMALSSSGKKKIPKNLSNGCIISFLQKKKKLKFNHHSYLKAGNLIKKNSSHPSSHSYSSGG